MGINHETATGIFMRRPRIAAGVIVCRSQRVTKPAAREQELSAALLAGNGVIIIGGTDDFAFTFRARNRIHRHLAIQDGIGDPIMMNGFQDHNYNPARDGFINNPARGRFMFNAPIRR